MTISGVEMKTLPAEILTEGERGGERESEAGKQGGRCQRNPSSTNQQLPAAGGSAHISVTHSLSLSHTPNYIHTYIHHVY